jgi:hypothetical protein
LDMYEWFVQDTFWEPGPALSDEATARTVNFRCEALTHFTESTSEYSKRSNAASLGQSTHVIMLQGRLEFVVTTTDREITISETRHCKMISATDYPYFGLYESDKGSRWAIV